MKYQGKDLAAFPKQIQTALDRYRLNPLKRKAPKNVVIAGLGGSGIAGHIAKAYFSARAPFPIEVVSEYVLPAYVNEETLVLVSSYSGNTEETLGMYEDAKAKGASIVVLTTGGQLAEIAQEEGLPVYKADAGFQPRMALGYSLTYLLLSLANLMGADCHKELREVAEAMQNEEEFIKSARELFDRLEEDPEKKVVIIADRLTAPIALRFAQQMNENAKGEAFIHPLPEMNHNVIESYTGKRNSHFFLLNSHLNDRVSLRFEFMDQLLRDLGNEVNHLHLHDSNLKSIFRLIYRLDWLSLLVAQDKGVNSVEIPNIKRLKEELKKEPTTA